VNAIKETDKEEDRRMLEYLKKYKFAVGISAILFFIIVSLLFLAVLKGILNIRKL